MRYIVSILFFGILSVMGISIASEQKIDFDKLFESNSSNSSKKVIERKEISRDELEKARAATDSIETPRTWIGSAAKAMFTCDDCSRSDYIMVNASCSGFCSIKKLTLMGGNKNFGSNGEGNWVSIMKSYNNESMAGYYSYVATSSNKKVCSGSFHTDALKGNISLSINFSSCDVYISEF